MGAYTKLNQEEVKNILNLYGLKGLSQLTPMTHGISNSNYLLEIDNKKYILKVSNDKNSDQLKQEQLILGIIGESGLNNIVNSIPLTSGEHVYEYENYYGVIYPFVDGTVPNINKKTCYKIGSALGKLHINCSKVENTNARYFDEVGHSVGHILSYVKLPHAQKKYIEYFERFNTQDFIDFTQELFPQGIIHGDLYFDNTLVNKSDEIILLDFEQSGIGEFILDIGISISGTCLNEDNEINPKLVNEFISGYQEQRNLSQTELKYLNTSIILGLFSIALWRIDRFNHKKIVSSKDESYLELLERAIKFKETL